MLDVSELLVRELCDDELGRWSMFVRDRHPALAGFVGSYQGYTQHALAPGRHATFVTHMFPLVISLEGANSIVAAGGESTVVDSFLAGFHLRPVTVEAAAFRGVQIDLTPLGAFALLQGGVGDLTDRTAPLDAVLGRRARELVERVGNATSWADRLEQTETLLRVWTDEAPTPSREVIEAWDAIVASGGQRSIQEVASVVGWSRHHLGRQMRRQLGVSPKRLARVVRFQNALKLVMSRRVPLAEVALRAGYFDQAHMNSDFQEFAGRSPGSFVPRVA